MSDAGLSAQRTRLAWRRTAVAAAVVTLLAARPAVTDPAPGTVLAGAAALAGWAVLVAAVRRRERGLRGARPAEAGWSLPGTALATVAYAALGALLIGRLTGG
ncbi:DUF202 domain-containing protein [Spirilliplanes yamanashiensis]|uniref:DUF202 domain-containing protein n=1 Tax=Spirilliplanes yamanashiensis TaxID=42233 RepID=A0A8J4DGS3_9ACTN|nr:DUF202 domain-containing protein [Spirilliplanes yamanashiensis]MDP9819835.1 uncharacterized membrane protein YidH (DUF202 family) [Spirilliplanes yamanashiensis]GIJ01346.1 hypothetical protein Sya03_06980 [Spirilliplanes yamanashiensis]